jgi:hypothetical protein
MKQVLLTVLQFVLFLLVFATGSFLPPFHIERVLAVTRDGTRIFIWDGALLMVALFVLILLIQAISKRIRTAAPWTALAFVLAGAAGYAAKLGFLTRPQ